MQNTTKSELIELVSNMRIEIQKDIKPGTKLPQFYQELLSDLDRADKAITQWNYDLCFDIIGEINLDMLEIVDDLDDIIWVTMQNLYSFKKRLEVNWEDLPKEIYCLLKDIQKIIG